MKDEIVGGEINVNVPLDVNVPLELYNSVISCWVKARFQMPMSSKLPLRFSPLLEAPKYKGSELLGFTFDVAVVELFKTPLIYRLAIEFAGLNTATI